MSLKPIFLNIGYHLRRKIYVDRVIGIKKGLKAYPHSPFDYKTRNCLKRVFC